MSTSLLEQWQRSFIGDKAYVGRRNTTTPHKKPPKGALTPAQKHFNPVLSQQRVCVEHGIRVLKIVRVVKGVLPMPSSVSSVFTHK